MYAGDRSQNRSIPLYVYPSVTPSAVIELILESVTVALVASSPQTRHFNSAPPPPSSSLDEAVIYALTYFPSCVNVQCIYCASKAGRKKYACFML